MKHDGWPAGLLLAGVCLYPCETGPFCVVEYASLSPWVHTRLRHQAAVALVDGIRSYGAMRNKNMLCFPRDKGVLRLLDKGGFTRSPAICVYHTPFNLTGFTFTPKAAAPSGGSSTASEDSPKPVGVNVKPRRRK